LSSETHLITANRNGRFKSHAFSSIRFKASFIFCLLILVIASLGLTLYSLDARRCVEKAFIERARSILLVTEATRDNVATKWKSGIFNQQQLRAWADEQRHDLILQSVPVVTAWDVAQQNASKAGYEFRVTREDPRNPANAPDEVERRVLKMFEDSDLDEHYEVDNELNVVRYFRPIRLTNDCLVCHGDPAKSEPLWGNTAGLDPTGAPMENWRAGEVRGAFEIIHSLDAADQLIARKVKMAGITTGLIVIIAGGIFLFGIRQIVGKPILRVVDAVRDIAQGEGDLTQRLPVKGGDELAELSHWFNHFVQHLQGIMREVRNTSESVTRSASGLSTTACQLASGAVQTQTESSQLARSMEQMAAAITEVAASAEKAADSAEDVSQKVEVASDRMTSLQAATVDVERIADIIQNIAEQTNLLALNAAIESARAGEAGRGFAVVATSVRELAKQTANATDDIRLKISSMKCLSDETVFSVRDIAAAIQSIDAISHAIATAVEEQSITSRQISENMTLVDVAAKETSLGAELIQGTSRDLSDVSSGLSATVANFKI